MEQFWDPRGEAGAALARVVEGFGPQVLGRADMLTGLLEDEVPHLTREVALLTAAARSGTSGLLTERVQQGLSSEQAVSMAAAEMTARTAMDASGARWAVGEFARVLGHPLQATTPVAPGPQASADDATRTARVPPAAYQPTALADGSPVGPAPTAPAPAPAGPSAATVPTRGLAVAAAVAVGIAGVMAPFWSLASFTGSANVIYALEEIMLLIGCGWAAVWVARRGRDGTGFAAVLGIAAPAAAQAIFYAADAPNVYLASSGRRDALEFTMVLWVAAALMAAGIAVTGLARTRRFARHRAGRLAVVTAAASVGFALANILAQNMDHGSISQYILGPGITGWWIVWGILFLVLVSLPPLLAGFLLPVLKAKVAVWSGWLIFAMAWQIGDSPINGASPAYGLALTWILWAAVLAGTVVMAVRARSATPAAPSTPASP